MSLIVYCKFYCQLWTKKDDGEHRITSCDGEHCTFSLRKPTFCRRKVLDCTTLVLENHLCTLNILLPKAYILSSPFTCPNTLVVLQNIVGTGNNTQNRIFFTKLFLLLPCKHVLLRRWWVGRRKIISRRNVLSALVIFSPALYYFFVRWWARQNTFKFCSKKTHNAENELSNLIPCLHNWQNLITYTNALLLPWLKIVVNTRLGYHLSYGFDCLRLLSGVLSRSLPKAEDNLCRSKLFFTSWVEVTLYTL